MWRFSELGENRVALFDTRDDSHQLVDPDSSYWFRSLARGPEGEVLELTYDGEVTKSIDLPGTLVEMTAVTGKP